MFGFGQRQMQRKKIKDRRIQDKREPYWPSIPVKVDKDWTEDEFNWLPSWLSNWISHYSTISAISCASMFLSNKKQKWYKRDFGSIHTRGMYWGFLVQFKCIISLTEEWKKTNLPKLILLLTKSREGLSHLLLLVWDLVQYHAIFLLLILNFYLNHPIKYIIKSDKIKKLFFD